jgi:D-xylose transport system substrate-binding protein
MKKILGFVFGIALLTIVSSCSENSNKKIGLLVHTTKSTRWQMDIQYIQDKADELGVEVLLRDANNNEGVQLMQAEELLDEGVAVLIVIAANQNTAAGIVRSAHNKKVPVIAYDRLIRNADVDYLVSFHYEKVGRLLAGYVAKKKPNGNCVVLYGDANDGNARSVKKGIEKELLMLDKGSRPNIVYECFVESWSYNNSNHIVNHILDFYPEHIDAVIACNDPLGIGAQDALYAHGYAPREVIITGQDATTDFLRSMLNGGMTMSVYKPIKELAVGAVEMAFSIINKTPVDGINGVVNNGRNDVPSILFEPSVVDVSNYKTVFSDQSELIKELNK